VNELKRSSGRIPALDGLRGMAILLVLVAHYVASSEWLRGPPGSNQGYVRASLGLAATGVDLFFVLSGFLIGGILLDHRASPRLLPAFYARRGFRILPVAWLSIAASMLANTILSPGTEPAIPWWVSLTFSTNIFLAANNGWILSYLTSHWSLAIEEQFYLVFPVIVRLWPAPRLRWLGPALIASALVSRLGILLFFPGHDFVCQMLVVCRADSLGVGFLAAWLVRSNPGALPANRRRWLWSLLLVGGGCMIVLTRLNYRAPFHFFLWGYTAIAFFYGCLLLLVQEPRQSWLKRIFTFPLLRLYGQYSYFIYVFQLLLTDRLVSLVFQGHFRGMPMLTPWHSTAAILLILVPAALSSRFVESPLLRIGHRWSYE
jgi:peptidoglycan/LPS O-acetylase OafA/YrhL